MYSLQFRGVLSALFAVLLCTSVKGDSSGIELVEIVGGEISAEEATNVLQMRSALVHAYIVANDIVTDHHELTTGQVEHRDAALDASSTLCGLDIIIEAVSLWGVRFQCT